MEIACHRLLEHSYFFLASSPSTLHLFFLDSILCKLICKSCSRADAGPSIRLNAGSEKAREAFFSRSRSESSTLPSVLELRPFCFPYISGVPLITGKIFTFKTTDGSAEWYLFSKFLICLQVPGRYYLLI